MSRTADIVLQSQQIVKSFPSRSGEGTIDVLEGVSVDIHRAEITAIVGSSGSGKSTLLHILGGLDHPDSGSVFWNGDSIFTLDSETLAAKRNRSIGFVFQFHHLLPEFTALENVLMPALIGGSAYSNASKRALDLLDRFGIADRAAHRPAHLSGGEQQRVSMARALMNNPSVILADEPTGNLDEENTDLILNELIQLRDSEEVGMILITHEKDIAARCDTVYELKQGLLHKYERRIAD